VKRSLGIFAFAAIIVACSASFWQNAAKVATAVAECVAPIVLDVTGLATEDPVQIATSCEVAVVDVYNWISQALNSAIVVTSDGGAAAHYMMKTSGPGGAYYYCTPAQFARLQRIQARAATIVDAGGQ